jgi:hypothetical protein
MATLIRRTSGDGAELVAFYFGVLRGESYPLADSGRRQRPTLALVNCIRVRKARGGSS